MKEPGCSAKLSAFTKITIFFFFFFFFLFFSCLCFNYTTFLDETTIDFTRTDACITADTVQVTRGFVMNRSGRFQHHKSFRLSTSSFNTSFLVQINTEAQAPQGGLAFIATGDSTLPHNRAGRWLDVVDSDTGVSSRLAKTLPVEPDIKKSAGRWHDHVVDLKNKSADSVHQESTPGSTGQVSTHHNCKLPSWAWVVISVGALGTTTGVVIFICWTRKLIIRKKKKHVDDGGGDDAHSSIEEAIRRSSTAPKRFNLSELSEATENYHSKNKLGEGGFGTVYKGILENHLVVAVKKVSQVTSQGKQEFVAEVTTIGNLRHKNLVKLIGWARERCEYLLVYEYMPNGSLEKFIFAPESSAVLTWRTRHNIITGVAKALEYLHNGCEKRVLHRDIKASNIMLDSKFEPKLGDFGLARTIMQADQTHHSTKALAGTPGYMAPELFLTGRSTPETDVYAFGILVLEVVCGRKPRGEGGGNLDQYEYAINIVKWVWELYGGERLIDAADRRMERDFEEEEEEMCRVLTMGLGCCHPDPYNRPSMKTVLQVLTGEEVLTGPEVPLQMPPFFWPPNASSFEDRHSLTGSQVNEQLTEIVGR